jgi:DNA-binding response OmpR family regulator
MPVVILTAYGSLKDGVGLPGAGAFVLLAKPFQMEELLAVVQSALRSGT